MHKIELTNQKFGVVWVWVRQQSLTEEHLCAIMYWEPAGWYVNGVDFTSTSDTPDFKTMQEAEDAIEKVCPTH